MIRHVLFSNRHFCSKYLSQLLSLHKNRIISVINYHSDSIEDNAFVRTAHYDKQISFEEATRILQTHEVSIDLDGNSPVKYYEANHLAANNPTEDRQAQARIHSNDSPTFVFGVFDGHGGPWCSDVVRQRLFEYIATSLQSPKELKKVMQQAREMISHHHNNISPLLLHVYYNVYKDLRNSKVKEIHEFNLLKHIEEVYTTFDSDYTDIISALENSFIKLDRDICAEAIPTETQPVNRDLLRISITGSCACVALIKDKDLYIANCGDSRAVLGTIDSDGNPSAIPLTSVHNSINESEIKRVLSEHPSDEQLTVIRGDRLLGLLSPLRAFGDIRFKWPKNYLKEYIQPYYKKSEVIPQFYLTPPYLTVRPEIVKRKLTKNDKFLVLATDGIWETLPPETVVQIIFNYQKGIEHFDGFSINPVVFSQEKQRTIQRVDQNAATNLIRHALSYTPEGEFDSQLLLNALASPNPRSARDDITVTIVYFDQDYLE